MVVRTRAVRIMENEVRKKHRPVAAFLKVRVTNLGGLGGLGGPQIVLAFDLTNIRSTSFSLTSLKLISHDV